MGEIRCNTPLLGDARWNTPSMGGIDCICLLSKNEYTKCMIERTNYPTVVVSAHKGDGSVINWGRANQPA